MGVFVAKKYLRTVYVFNTTHITSCLWLSYISLDVFPHIMPFFVCCFDFNTDRTVSRVFWKYLAVIFEWPNAASIKALESRQKVMTSFSPCKCFISKSALWNMEFYHLQTWLYSTDFWCEQLHLLNRYLITKSIFWFHSSLVQPENKRLNLETCLCQRCMHSRTNIYCIHSSTSYQMSIKLLLTN